MRFLTKTALCLFLLYSSLAFAQQRIEFQYFDLVQSQPESCSNKSEFFRFFGNFDARQLPTKFQAYKVELSVIGNFPTQDYQFNDFYNSGFGYDIYGEVNFPDSGIYNVRAVAKFFLNDSTSYIDTSDFVTFSYGSSTCRVLSGNMYYDKNQNCEYDSLDSPIANRRVMVGERDGEILLTDNNGYYETLIPKLTPNGFGTDLFSHDFILNEDSTSYYTLSCDIPNLRDSISSLNVNLGYKDTLWSSTELFLESFLQWQYLNNCDSNTEALVSFSTHKLLGNNLTIPTTLFFGDGDSLYHEFNYGDEFNEVIHEYKNPGIYYPTFLTKTNDTAFFETTDPVFISDTCGNVSGTLYRDLNENCLLDSNESGIANINIVATWLGKTYFAKTNSNGKYSFLIPTNINYTLKVANTNLNGVITYGSLINTQACPVIVSDSANLTNFNFGVNCAQFKDLAVDGTPPRTRPGFINNHNIQAINLSCSDIESGILSYELDSLETFVSTTLAQDSIVNNKIYWFIDSLGIGERRTINLKVKLDSTATLGSVICRALTFYPLNIAEADSSNNEVEVCNVVNGSYDPNDKTCFINGAADTSNYFDKGDSFTYRIRFQNTGTDSAVNIYILDTISEFLNFESFELLGSSHPMEYYFNDDRTIRFVFSDINLPSIANNEAESHGYINYRIVPDTNVDLLDKIENTAHIYFDFNSAIVTNTTVQLLRGSTVAVNENITGDDMFLNLHPNPTKERLVINFNNTNSKISVGLFDLTGRNVLNLKLKNNSEFSVASIPNGTYILKVVDLNGQKSLSERVVVQH